MINKNVNHSTRRVIFILKIKLKLSELISYLLGQRKGF